MRGEGRRESERKENWEEGREGEGWPNAHPNFFFRFFFMVHYITCELWNVNWKGKSKRIFNYVVQESNTVNWSLKSEKGRGLMISICTIILFSDPIGRRLVTFWLVIFRRIFREQKRVAKVIIGSQEEAYWRLVRPPVSNCVCVWCVCVHACVRVCVHVHACVCVYAQCHTCVCVWLCVRACVCICQQCAIISLSCVQLSEAEMSLAIFTSYF